MAITCAYKGKVETHVINQKWVMDNSNDFHKFSNILMKPERNIEWKYSMQVMSTTTTTNWKFRFTRGFMLVLELKGFFSAASNILDIFKCPQCYF